MKRLLCAFAIAFFAVAISARSHPVQAQTQTASCFNCLNLCDTGGHFDDHSVQSLLGEYHGSCVPWSCGEAGHILYGGNNEAPSPIEETKVALAGGDDALLVLLSRHPDIGINVERNALQRATSAGLIDFHIPLSPGQGARLQSALASAKTSAEKR